uniref:Uncharacterized protein n=1 Tax=Amphimedon queenslandica TaxID=400682 RepID=A0A1X7TM70_AMPQE
PEALQFLGSLVGNILEQSSPGRHLHLSSHLRLPLYHPPQYQRPRHRDCKRQRAHMTCSELKYSH